MNVIFELLGNVKIEHRFDIVYVNAPGSHVGGHQYAGFPHFEAVHHVGADYLAHVAVESRRRKTVLFQIFGQFVHHLFGVAEHHRPLRGEFLKQQVQCVHFFGLRNLVIILRDCSQGAFPLIDSYDLGIALEFLGDFHDGRRHSGGEKHRLPLLGDAFQNGLDVVVKPHVQHFVGFVQHDGT